MEMYVDDTRKITIERGQLWRVDKDIEKSMNKFREDNGDTWSYGNEVLIVQNTDTINPSSVLVVPTSLSSNSTHDVVIPLKGFCALMRGNAYAKIKNMFSIEPRHLVRCLCQYGPTVMKEIDDKLLELLISKEEE